MRRVLPFVLLALCAAPVVFADDPAPEVPAPTPKRKKPPEPRRFEAGKLTDPYWGVEYTTAGLEEKKLDRQAGILLYGKSGRVQIEIQVWEFADELGAKERRDAEKKKWDGKKRQQEGFAQGDDPAPWATFQEEAPSGGMRRHGYAWFTRGCRAFVVHAYVMADAEGGADGVKNALFGLTVGPETGAAVLVQAQVKAREMPPDDPGVLASAAAQYLQGDHFGTPERPAIAEDLLRRAIENLPGSLLERNPAGLSEVWQSFGNTLVKRKKFDEAIPALVKGVEFAGKTMAPGPDTANANYNLACGYSLVGKVDEAFATLDKAFAKFAPVPQDHLEKDPDLENCRKDPRWAKWLENRPTKSSK